METISDDASRSSYGILTAPTINLELARGLIAAADELQSPLIILVDQMQMTKHVRTGVMVLLIRTLVEETNVPVALILDHRRDWKAITHAYRNGFSPIMIGASACEMEENIRGTKKVIEMCHPQGVAVEAELGHVGQVALGDQTDDSYYTRPEDVTEFLNQTRVSCLATTCGTAHGQYPKGVTPGIRFDVIRAVERVMNVPIVLHSSSGSGNEDIKKAVEADINKVSICTEVFNYVHDKIRETLEQAPKIDLLSLISRTKQTTKEIGKYFICLTGSQGKAANFQRKSALQYGFAQTETDGGGQGEELTKAAPKGKRKCHNEGK